MYTSKDGSRRCKMANYSFQDPALLKGSVVDSGNFTQAVPNTEIMTDKTLTINGGNFTNVKKQPEWKINGGNWTQIDFCSHLHPEFVGKGLPECGTECKHLDTKDEIEVDNVIVDTIYTYKDIRI